MLSASPERFLRVDAARARRDAPDQGHAAARRRPRARRRARPRAHRERQGSRREPDDRRPDAQRPVARLRAGHRARAGAVRARALRHRPSPRLDRRRRSRAGQRRARPAARGLSRRLDHRRAEGARDGDHRRARAVASAASTAARSATGASPARSTRSIAIRTAVARGGRVYFSAGGGIVADSDPEQEYRETLDKARGMIDALARRRHDPRSSTTTTPSSTTSRATSASSATTRSCAATTRSTLDEIEALAPSHIILSPGPCTPAEAGISTDIVRRFGPTIPILGVCLGHQCIGAAYGGDIVRAGRPMHGTDLADRRTTARASSPGLPSPLRVARYHSLVIARAVAAAVAARDRLGGRRRRDHGGRAPRASGRRRAVPSRVGGQRVRLRDARPLPARRAARLNELPQPRGRRARAPRKPRSRKRGAVDGALARCRRRVRAAAGGAGAVSDELPAVWVNGERQSSDRPPHLGARSRPHAGDGVFETMRVYGGTVFRLDRHLARLVHGLAALDIPAPPELGNGCCDALRAPAAPRRASASP